MLKTSYASCLGLSLAILAQFTFKMCVAAPNCKKIIKTHYFKNLRLFRVIDVDLPKNLVTSACYDMQHVCASLQPFSR